MTNSKGDFQVFRLIVFEQVWNIRNRFKEVIVTYKFGFVFYALSFSLLAIAQLLIPLMFGSMSEGGKDR